jgi:hypothetical protein
VLLLLFCQLEALLARVDDWQFDSFRLAAVSGNRPLSVLAFFLLKRSNLVKRVRLQRLHLTVNCFRTPHSAIIIFITRCVV